MVNELKYSNEVQKKIDEKLSAKANRPLTYGDWSRMEGVLEEIPQTLIEEIKGLMYEVAKESLAQVGVDIEQQEIEWIIRQNYTDGDLISDDPFEGAKAYITIAWKTVVNPNG
jgi:formate dehydrogenase maturation protein FdhE